MWGSSYKLLLAYFFFFCIWISNYSSMLCWKRLFPLNTFSRISHIYVGLFQNFLFQWSLCLNTNATWWSWWKPVSECFNFFFMFFKIILAILVPLTFHTHFRISLSLSELFQMSYWDFDLTCIESLDLLGKNCQRILSLPMGMWYSFPFM